MSGSFQVDFGENVPGETVLATIGTTDATGYLLRKKKTVFAAGSVPSGGRAVLPSSYASGTELTVCNRSANALTISATSNQIESYGSTVAVAPAGNSTFTSFDPPASPPPRTWWLTALLLLLFAATAQAQTMTGNLLVQNNLSEIAAGGSGAQAAARSNLGGVGPNWIIGGVFTNTQMNLPFQFLLGGINPTTEYNGTQGTTFLQTAALTAGAAANSSSTVSMVAGFASYVNTSSPSSNAVGLFVNCRGLATAVQCFGINESVTDTVVPAAGGGGATSYALNALIANESDVECANLGTACIGYNMLGIFPNGNPGRFGYAYQASAYGTYYGWNVGFNCATGGALQCVVASQLGSGTPSNSQPILFVATAGDTSTPVCAIYETAGATTGNLTFQCQDGGLNIGSPTTVFANLTLGNPLIFVKELTTATFTATGTQATGATEIVVSSTSGVTTGNGITGSPSLSPQTNVTVVDGTHLALSAPLLAPITGGTSLSTYSVVTTGSISSTTSTFQLQAPSGQSVIFLSPIQLPPSGTGGAGLNVAPGVAPTSPNNGDLWATSSALDVRIGSTTYNLIGAGQFLPLSGGSLTGEASVTLSTAGAALSLANTAGTCTHTPGASSETVACSSDVKFKRDVTAAPFFSGWLWDLPVRQFTLKSTGQRVVGVVAQELQKTHPEMVHENVAPDGSTYLSVDQPNPWRMVKAIQELQAFAAAVCLIAFLSVLLHAWHFWRHHKMPR